MSELEVYVLQEGKCKVNDLKYVIIKRCRVSRNIVYLVGSRVGLGQIVLSLSSSCGIELLRQQQDERKVIRTIPKYESCLKYLRARNPSCLSPFFLEIM